METDYQNYVESLSGVSSDEDDISTADSSDESTEEPTTVPVAPPRTRNLMQMLYDREVCFTEMFLNISTPNSSLSELASFQDPRVPAKGSSFHSTECQIG